MCVAWCDVSLSGCFNNDTVFPGIQRRICSYLGAQVYTLDTYQQILLFGGICPAASVDCSVAAVPPVVSTRY